MGNKYTNTWSDREISLFFNNLLPNESWDSFRKRELPNRGLHAVRSKGRALGVSNSHYRSRKYTFNKDVWKTLSPESCYYGAFIATDGCLVKSSVCSSYSLAIDLQESDSDVLEKFKVFCGYTGFVRKPQVRSENSVSRSLVIALNQDWLEDLKKHYNITPRKTHSLQPPNIDDEFLKNCYLIGALDGDGSIQLYKKITNKTKAIQISLVSASLDYADWIQNRFDDVTTGCSLRYNNTSGKRKIVHDRQYFKAGISGLAACVLVDYFRQFPVPKLDRKWNKPELVDFIESQKLLYPDKFLTLEIPPQYQN